jgi:hypothetical protein
VHAIANVLDALPKRLQGNAKKLLHEMMEAPSRADCRPALGASASDSTPSTPRSVAVARTTATNVAARQARGSGHGA